MSGGQPKPQPAPIALTAETPLAPVEKPTLIIAMTPRSGSTNLCSVLAKLKIFGDPQEFFNPRGPMAHFSKVNKATNASDYLAAIAARAETFCFKVAAVDWVPFAARAKQVFPNARYVFLDRIDIDAQAISLFRAKASQHWHIRENTKTPAPPPPPPPRFDAAAIETCRQELMQERRRWLDYFLDAEIKPLCVSYEQLLGDMPRAVQKICAEAGVAVAAADISAGDYRVLRDDTTERWKKKLRLLRLETDASDEI